LQAGEENGVDSKPLPLWKVLEAPLLSLDESYVELFSLLCLFLLGLTALAASGRYRQWLRHLVQAVSLAVFLFVVYSCLGVFGMIRNTIYGLGLLGSVFSEAFFWISLPLVVLAFSVSGGPYFCGWICPTGTFQELAAWLSELIFGRRSSSKPSLTAQLALALFFAVFLALVFWLGNTRRLYVEDSSLFWGAALLLLVFMVRAGRADDRGLRVLRGVSFFIIFVSALLKTAIISPMHFAFADVADPASALTTLVLVVASLFLARAWCRYVCPFGYVLGKLHRFSRLRVVANSSCLSCSDCGRLCRVGAIERGRVRLENCQFCLACVDRCPQGGLEIKDVWGD
jgi:polyferredoxin